MKTKMDKNIAIKTGPKLANLFNNAMFILFSLFIFLTLSFGRAFSIFHVGYIFITEIFLFLGLFFLLLNLKKVVFIPVNFLIPFSLYFILSVFHLSVSLIWLDIYALRGIVYSGYVLFLPVTFIIFKEKKYLIIFLWIIVLSNIIGLTLVRLCIYRKLPVFLPLIHWWGQMRAFNLLLYYGITISFLVSFFSFTKKMSLKLLILLLCAFNCYMILIWGVRTSWISFIVLILFLTLVLKIRILKFSFYFLLIFLFITCLFAYSLDRNVFKEDVFLTKFDSLNSFLKKAVVNRTPFNTLVKTNKDIQEKMFGVKTNVPDKIEVKSTTADKEKDALQEDNKIQNDIKMQEGVKKKERIVLQQDEQNIDTKEKLVKKIRIADRQNYYSNILWRLIIWKHALIKALESPILGKGFKIDIKPSYGIEHREHPLGTNLAVNPIHNHIIAIFYKTGIMGLGLFIFMTVYCFLYGITYLPNCKIRFIKHFLTSLLGSMAFWHTMALLYDIIDSPPTTIFIWVIMGLIFASIYIDRNSLNATEDKNAL